MRDRLQFAILGLLLVPLAAVINAENAYAETFTVNIAPGSGVPGCEAENNCFDPFEITVPVGTTVVWKNGDSQGHTITSGNPTDEVFGQEFDSSFPLLPAEKTFEHTFDTAGTFPYFCQVHPYMLGKVIVTGAEDEVEDEMEDEMSEGTVMEGDQVDLIVNPPLPFDRAANEKVMLTFKSKGDDGKPIMHVDYRITVMKNGDAVFTHEFMDHDGVLELDIIPMDHDPQVSEPTTNDVGMGVTTAYGVMGNIFNENGNYEIKAEILTKGHTPLADPITETYSMEVVPEFPLTVVLPMLAAFGAVIVAARLRSLAPRIQ